MSACEETRVKGRVEQRPKVAFSHRRSMASCIAFPMYSQQRSKIKLRTSLVSLVIHTPFKKYSYMGEELLKIIDCEVIHVPIRL